MDNRKSKYWATIVYQESAAENWVNVLKISHVKCFISPLHDKDVDGDGNVKKAHWHVVFIFDNVTTDSNAKFIISIIGGVGCERVMSITGMARYLCHMDDPDKAQYEKKDVISLCGADYQSMIDNPENDMKTLLDICMFCEENNIISYAQLVEFVMYEKKEWWETVVRKSQFLHAYLKSKGWTQGLNKEQ